METINIKVEQDDDAHDDASLVEIEEEETNQGESGDEKEEGEELCPNTSQTYLSAENEDEYGVVFSEYTTTLYDAAMEAVTQNMLTNKNISNRKKSPAWNHFFISPRDSTKAICMYCMKEFSRGKNEKDLSTSCLMRHVRRAHPRVLASENGNASGISSYSSPTLVLPLQPPDVVDTGATPTKIRVLGSKLYSPEKIKEEPSPVLSSDEISSDVSISERNGRDDVTVSPPALSNSQPDENMAVTTDKQNAAQKNSSGSRRRSAVWKHFYLSPLDNSKAVCIHCMNEFSRGKNGKDLGTSCLIRHMWRAHRSIVLQENSAGASLPPPYSVPPTLLPSLLPADGGDVSTTVSPSRTGKDSVSVPPSPDRVSEDLQYCTSNGDLIIDDGTSLPHSSENMGDASMCSPEKQSDSRGTYATVQQNKKAMKRLKSEVWLHFTVSPNDHLKAICRYCNCMISRGKKGDLDTSCLIRHLCRRHPEIVFNQKSFDVSLANSPYATLASAECSSSKMTELSTSRIRDNQVVFPSSSKKTSKLWNHFSICSADSTKVICMHCGRTISRGKKPTNLGTSCLLRHLQRFHSNVLQTNGVSETVPSADVRRSVNSCLTVSSFDETNDKFSDTHPVAKKITSLVAEMIALDLQPYSFVDNVGFNRLLEYLQPQYSLPSPSYFSRTAIPDMYETVKHIIVSHLKEAESGVIHFTAGIWMSSQTREYLTLTAHWVTFDSAFKPHSEDHHCSALLHVSQIDCDYNGVSVQKHLEYLWESWISSFGLQIGITVTDNHSIGKTLNENDRSSVECFGHTVDLIVYEAIKSQRMVQNVLSIARKICERVHRSARAKEKLAELQKTYGLPLHPLIQDVPSKWNTSFHMLERLIEQKGAINEMSIECNFRELISCDQWEVMQSICHALKPFEAASKEMSMHTATLSQVIPMIHILNRKIEMLFEETMGIDTMLKSLKEAMVCRLSSTLHDPRYVFATLLDPRYKASLFAEEEAEEYKLGLIRELEILNSTSDDAPVVNGCNKLSSPSHKEDNIWSLMANIKKSKTLKEKLPEDIVMAYLEEEVLEHNCDPLTYWNLKKSSWPVLSKLAVRFLGCPPSVVPSEKLFNTSNDTGTFNQNRLMMEHFEQLIFLRVNLPLIYFQY